MSKVKESETATVPAGRRAVTMGPICPVEQQESDMTVIELLRMAAAANEAVTLTYRYGSHAGALGIVIPVAIDGDYLQAIVDPTTRDQRQFRLARIATVRRINGDCASNDAAACRLDIASVLV